MSLDITIKIGGEAGQGIQTVGQLLAMTCRESGLYVFGINDFESRIRGGHSFFQLRISDHQVRAPHHNLHMLVAMDENTVKLHKHQVLSDGTILINTSKIASSGNALAISFDEIAKKAGSPITANTAAAGATLALLGAPFSSFKKVLQKQFHSKSSQVLNENLTAAQLGFDAVKGVRSVYAFSWSDSNTQKSLIEGTQAIAFGALAGDCRFAAFYPMSPATGIMLHLAACQDRFPIVVEQAEDEIAAINMIIGAAYAGVRSITATSGGGFCLMTEAVGLAGITETPAVIVNAQRPGPATGLATRTAQGDLHFVIRAGQDEFPRFVFAPSSPEEGYAVTARSLALAEKYQVPVIILVDQFFNDSLYSLDNELIVPETIDRFVIESSILENPASYNRYAHTQDGVSPRALPCKSLALVKTCGNEHREDGHTSEAINDRISMVDKRARKITGMLSEMRPPHQYHADADMLLIGWGSTAGVIRESVDLLRSDGIDAGCLHFCDLWPFPVKAATALLPRSQQFFIVEQNSTAQFAQLLRQETGLVPAGTVLKYDGRPLYPAEVYESVKKQMR